MQSIYNRKFNTKNNDNNSKTSCPLTCLMNAQSIQDTLVSWPTFYLQVWFQNARAKNRRNTSKSEEDAPKDNDIKPSSLTAEESEKLLDLSSPRSPTMSEISSSRSMADSIDTQERMADHSSDSLTELFSDDMNVQ